LLTGNSINPVELLELLDELLLLELDCELLVDDSDD
jgi:hypothetical protein